MQPRLALLAPTLLATACATTPPMRPAEGPAKLGQAVWVDGPTVRPLAVIEDGRCPVNVRCVWAGRIVVRVEVTGGAWRRTVELAMGGPKDAEGVQVADGRLRLVSVTPDRHTTRSFASRDYRFTFAFDGGY